MRVLPRPHPPLMLLLSVILLILLPVPPTEAAEKASPPGGGLPLAISTWSGPSFQAATKRALLFLIARGNFSSSVLDAVRKGAPFLYPTP